MFFVLAVIVILSLTNYLTSTCMVTLQACEVVNGEEMRCPTPEIQLPSDIVRISKRDLSHFSEVRHVLCC